MSSQSTDEQKSPTSYTFELSPGRSTRYNAGPYDQKAQMPRYAFEVSLPQHVTNQFEYNQFLMGNEGSRIWVWDFKNKSSWPAFVSIFKDDVLVKYL